MPHKLVQSPEGSNRLMAWFEIGMIRIDEGNLCPRREELLTRESLHRRLSTDGHKGRSMDETMWRLDNPRTCSSIDGFESKRKWFFHKKSAICAEYREKGEKI